MKLNEVYSKPLCEVIKSLELTDMKIHSDDSGCVKAIELKYVTSDRASEKKDLKCNLAP